MITLTDALLFAMAIILATGFAGIILLLIRLIDTVSDLWAVTWRLGADMREFLDEDTEDANKWRERLEADWPTMPDLQGVDIFAEKYGAPSGKD